jgi:hypothetical protein
MGGPVTGVLVDEIGELATHSTAVGDELLILTSAAVVVENDRIASVGPSA